MQRATPTATDHLEVVTRKHVEAAAASGRPILLFNPNCEVCNAIAGWVKRQDAMGGDHIEERPLPADPADLEAIHPGLDIWKAYEQIHVVMPDGTLRVGGAAIAEVLRRLPGKAWIGALTDLEAFGVRPFLLLLHAGYLFLDKIRPALGCSSCGGGAVKWWAMPIKWTADAVKALRRLLAPAPSDAAVQA